MTTLLWVQANTRRQLEDATEQANKNRAADYDTQWEQFKKNRDAQPAVLFIEPMPANEQHVIVGPSGWPEAVDTGQFVTLPRLYVAPKLTPKVSIFGNASAAAPAVDPFANQPLYTHKSAADGSVWLRIG